MGSFQPQGVQRGIGASRHVGKFVSHSEIRKLAKVTVAEMELGERIAELGFSCFRENAVSGAWCHGGKCWNFFLLSFTSSLS